MQHGVITSAKRTRIANAEQAEELTAQQTLLGGGVLGGEKAAPETQLSLPKSVSFPSALIRDQQITQTFPSYLQLSSSKDSLCLTTLNHHPHSPDTL